MALKTPPLYAKGVYSVLTPFVVTSGVTYECIAIRSFADFTDPLKDVFTRFYEPKGITQAKYEEDLVAGASIITLASGSESVLYIPDTYIDSYPDQTGVAYHRVVMSVDLGAVPDELDLTFLTNQLQGVVEDTIGIEGASVVVNSGPSTGVVTQAQHEAMEIGREAAITNRETDRARLIAVQAQLDAALQKIALLEQILIDNGLLN